jgi:hypothetical protein
VKEVAYIPGVQEPKVRVELPGYAPGSIESSSLNARPSKKHSPYARGDYDPVAVIAAGLLTALPDYHNYVSLRGFISGHTPDRGIFTGLIGRASERQGGHCRVEGHKINISDFNPFPCKGSVSSFFPLLLILSFPSFSIFVAMFRSHSQKTTFLSKNKNMLHSDIIILIARRIRHFLIKNYIFLVLFGVTLRR